MEKCKLQCTLACYSALAQERNTAIGFEICNYSINLIACRFPRSLMSAAESEKIAAAVVETFRFKLSAQLKSFIDRFMG